MNVFVRYKPVLYLTKTVVQLQYVALVYFCYMKCSTFEMVDFSKARCNGPSGNKTACFTEQVHHINYSKISLSTLSHIRTSLHECCFTDTFLPIAVVNDTTHSNLLLCQVATRLLVTDSECVSLKKCNWDLKGKQYL